jgi:hypothetical protein
MTSCLIWLAIALPIRGQVAFRISGPDAKFIEKDQSVTELFEMDLHGMDFLGAIRLRSSDTESGPNEWELECYYRTSASIGVAGIYPFMVDSLSHDALRQLCMHLHIFRVETWKTDDFSRSHFISQPRDSDGCRFSATDAFWINVCPRSIELSPHTRGCSPIKLLLDGSSEIRHVAEFAWDAPLELTQPVPCIESVQHYDDTVQAVPVYGSQSSMASMNGTRRIRKKFTCHSRESPLPWSLASFSRTLSTGGHEMTPAEHLEAYLHAKHHCAVVYRFIKSEPILNGLIFAYTEE